MSKGLIVITVGESLREQYAWKLLEEALKGNPGTFGSQRDPLHKAHIERCDPDDNYEGVFRTFWRSFGSLASLPTTATEWQNLAVPCAELQSLLLLLAKPEEVRGSVEQVDVVLIPTADTKPLADEIRDQVRSNWETIQAKCGCPALGSVTVNSVVNVEPASEAEFLSGMQKLAAEVLALAANHCYQRVWLNLTGGYKGIIPLLSLLGFTSERIRICYAHEKSGTIIVMPDLPVSWDRRRLDEIRGLLGRAKLTATEYAGLPLVFRYLFHRPRSSNEYLPSAWSSLAQNAAGKLTTRFGYGRYLLELVKDDHYRPALEKKLGEWEYLWVGDVIPETVEHGRLHTARLAVFAHQLFSLWPDLKAEVGGDRGLYLLICAIWLHDIGHTALEYTAKDPSGKQVTWPIHLFPSLVRDWHHFTSAAMVRDSKRNLMPTGNPKDREIVALMIEYHRGKMKLTGPEYDNPFSHGLLEPKCQSLETRLNGTALNGLTKDNILTLTAILRFIDGCDVQSDRAGEPEYVQKRMARTAEEKTALEKLLGTLPAACDYGQCKQALENNNAALLEKLSLGDRILFKGSPEKHFAKHSSIELVYLQKTDAGKLRVCLKPIAAAPGQEAEVNAYVAKAAADIYREYAGTEDRLKKAGIELEGVYRMDGNTETPLAEPTSG